MVTKPSDALLQAQAEIARLTAERDAALADSSPGLLKLVCAIRFAVGDDGTRMQPELVEYLRKMRADVTVLRDAVADAVRLSDKNVNFDARLNPMRTRECQACYDKCVAALATTGEPA